MTVRTFTIDQLCVSEHNVRTNAEAIATTGALEESIAAAGLFLPLIVHPLDDGRFGVLDGGRRYRSIRKLVDAGRLPADWPIDCVVRDGLPAEITELSLAAFLLARDLLPYEVHAAVATANAQGASVDDIARNLGQDARWVRQQLRLGRLAPEIFEAYAQGKISIDVARAYAATEDQELQRLAFAQFHTAHYMPHHERAIRQFFKVGDRELEQLLHFVGDIVYRAAGGRFELDLFADGPDERGRVVDEAKLRELAENALGLLKHQLRRRTGRSDIRFVPQAPQHGDRTDFTLEIVPSTRGDKIRIPAGDIVATIDIDGAGEAVTRWWWANRKAKAAGERQAAKPAPAASDPGGNYRPEPPLASDREIRAKIREGTALDPRNYWDAAQAARAAAREDHGLSANGLHVARSLRRELLRALLVQDVELTGGNLANDYVIWAQLRVELTDDRGFAVGLRGLTSACNLSDEIEPPEVKQHLVASEAHAIWTRACERIAAQPFITEPDAAAALSSFISADPETKALAAAVLAGLALLRSANSDGLRVAAHDRLAELTGGTDDDLRDLWTPQPEFLALFPKAQRLAIGEPLFGPSVIASWSKQGDADLARTAATALAGNSLSARPLRWVHPLLSFGVTEAAGAFVREAAQ